MLINFYGIGLLDARLLVPLTFTCTFILIDSEHALVSDNLRCRFPVSQ